MADDSRAAISEKLPRLIDRGSEGTATPSKRLPLPPDMLREALRRLGLFAAFSSVAIVLSIVGTTLFPALAPGDPALRLAVLLPFLAISIALAWSARAERIPPSRVLDVALVYQVVGCIAASIIINDRPWPHDQPLPSWSPVAVVVLVAPLLIPSTSKRIALAAVLSAVSDPIAFAVYAKLGVIAVPPVMAIVMRFAPHLVAVPIAIAISRVVHNLGERLTRARELGSYRLEARLGMGGMGEVWRASHRLLHRDAAVKLIRPEALASDGDPRAALLRFEREASAISALRSAHTVQLFDYGIASDGTLYYVMELLEGVDLEQLVRRHGAQPPERVVPMLRHVCHSLHEAHAAGLVHRDIKPANLFACRSYGGDVDHVKVLDFGLVRPLAIAPGSAAVTKEGAVTGTPAYIAPEIATGSQPLDARADLYALGCVAFFLLTGELVFDGKSGLEIAIKHATQPPRSVSALAKQRVPEALEEIVMALLEKDREKRPASARALDELLQKVPLERQWDEARARAWWTACEPLREPAERATPPAASGDLTRPA